VTRTRFTKAARSLLIAAIAIVGIGAAIQPAVAGGIRNCVDLTSKHSGQVGCYELVWADDTEYRMTFSNVKFSGAAPQDLDPFYVLAAETSAAQGYPPNTFPHDHVVRAIPSENGGTYSTRLQGFFVLCSGQGIASGACVPTWTLLGGPDPTPLAKTVNGEALTSTDAIEAAAAAGDLFLWNLGPTAVIVGSISATR
jgi:hypothetical protein